MMQASNPRSFANIMAERESRLHSFGCSPRAMTTIGAPSSMSPGEVQRERGHLYGVTEGVAVIPVIGPQGAFGWFGRFVMRAVEVVRHDPEVHAVLLDIDSPGGDTAGWSDLQQQLSLLAQAKPMYAIAHDIAASLGYWIALSAREIAMTPTAAVGSIGAASILFDSSKHDDEEGYRTILLGSSPRKGVGVPGLPITPELTDDREAYTDYIAASFFADVSRARGLSVDDVRNMDARIYHSGQARAMGLVDKVVNAADYIAEIIEKHRGGSNVAPPQTRAAAAASTGPTSATAPVAVESEDHAMEDEKKKMQDEIEALKAELEKAKAEAKAKAKAETEEEEEPRAEANSGTAATFAELKAAFGDSPAFVVEALEKGMSMAVAQSTYHSRTIAELKAQIGALSGTTKPVAASAPGAKPAQNGTPVFASAREAFANHPHRKRIEAIKAEKKCGVAAAILLARQEDPDGAEDYHRQTQG